MFKCCISKFIVLYRVKQIFFSCIHVSCFIYNFLHKNASSFSKHGDNNSCFKLLFFFFVSHIFACRRGGRTRSIILTRAASQLLGSLLWPVHVVGQTPLYYVSNSCFSVCVQVCLAACYVTTTRMHYISYTIGGGKSTKRSTKNVSIAYIKLVFKNMFFYIRRNKYYSTSFIVVISI